MISYQNRYECKEFSPEMIAPLRQKVSDWCAPVGNSRLDQLVLLTSEWLTNLVRHPEVIPTTVGLELKDDGKTWMLDIEDDGTCLKTFEQLMSSADTEFEELKTGGMGLGLIKSLSDQIEYSTSDGINCLTMRINKPESLAKKTIMVVDDDLSLLVLIEAYLEDEYQVETFSEADAALQWLKQHSPDLILSDINMPGMTGVEFRIKAQELNNSLPFIFLTGEESDNLSRLAIDDVLKKPVSKKLLLDKLDRVFVRHQQLQREISSQLAPAISNQLHPEVKRTTPGFKVYCAYRTAEGGGGDFVYQHDCADGQLLMLADVMGHDQQAKFFVHAYQGFLQGMAAGLSAAGCAITPDGFLNAFASSLEEVSLLGSSLLTAVAIKTDGSRDIEVASAGHPYPWLFDGDDFQTIELIGGPLLGFVGGSYQSEKIRLDGPLVLFTDGLIEDLSDEELVTVKSQIKQQLMQPEPDLNRVLDYYDDRSGVSVADDITLLVLLPG